MNEDQHTEFGARIARYLSGEMLPEERIRFEEELSSDREKETLYTAYARIWNGVDQVAARTKYDMDAEWDLLSEKVDFSDGSDLATDVKRDQSKSRNLRIFFYRAAAVLVIGLAGLAGWLFVHDRVQFDQVALEEGTEVVELEDGSVVTLNAGTVMKYAMDGSSGIRRVKLTGEAYFEIARDTARPFVIEAGSAVISVLGTSFNVNAYAESEIIEVTVHSGLVSMAAKNREERQIILNPGNSGIYNKRERDLALVTNADPNDIAWKTRELVFSESTLNEVIRVINHVYKANLALENPSLGNCMITVTFRNQDLGKVLEVITSTLDLGLQRSGDRIILTGAGCDQ